MGMFCPILAEIAIYDCANDRWKIMNNSKRRYQWWWNWIDAFHTTIFLPPKKCNDTQWCSLCRCHFWTNNLSSYDSFWSECPRNVCCYFEWNYAPMILGILLDCYLSTSALQNKWNTTGVEWIVPNSKTKFGTKNDAFFKSLRKKNQTYFVGVENESLNNIPFKMIIWHSI